MSFSIDDLFTPLDGDTVMNTWIDKLETYGIPAKSFRKAGVSRSILRVVAETFAGFTLVMSDNIKGGFLDSATGGSLTLLARYVYNVFRVESTFAGGKVTFTNAGGGVYSYGVGDVTVKSSINGKSYRNTEALTLGASTSATIAIQATELGTASNAGPGQVDTLVTTMIGVTVSNAAAVQATDEQTDEEVRVLCRAKLGTLSPRGPRSAYDYAARVAVRGDGSNVGVNRTALVAHTDTGVVDLYCATASGVVPSLDLDYIAASVEALARPDTVTANTHSVTAVPLSGALTVWAQRTAGWDVAAYTAAINAAIEAALSVYPIGGISKPPSTSRYLFASYVDGVVKSAHASIFAVDGATDLLLNAGEVATYAATLDIRIVG